MAKNKPLFDEMVVYLSSGSKFTVDQYDLGQLLTDHGALVVRNINSRVTHVVCDTKDTSGAVELAYKHGCKLIREDYFHNAIKTKKNKISDADLIDDDEMDSTATKTAVKKTPAKSASTVKKNNNNNNDSEEESTSNKKRKRDSDEESTEEKPQKKKQKTDGEKKLIPIDSHCHASGHIYVDGEDVWSCMLNQTNIGNNNNKFYLLQLIESADKKKYSVWMRWGRVGAKGQSSLTPSSSLKNAMGVFESKFSEKTGNSWSNRGKFVSKTGKYTMIDIDHGNESEEEDEDKPKKKSLIDASVPSKLDDKVKKLIELVFNRTNMINQMEKMNYDVKKMPLGKLKKSTLDKGYATLKKIESALKNNSGGLQQLSNEFYTLIPHNYGMKTPPAINSTALLKEKLQMLETLTDIEIANKLESESEEKQEPMHPTDARYRTLKTNIKPLDKKTEKFKIIEKFVKTTHAATHDKYTLKVLDVFEIAREKERDKFVKHCEEIFEGDAKNKAETNTQLLWHGSRISNYVGILSQGLRIAPPEAPSTGYMFGKGLYFADMVSKSANYCHVDFKKKRAVDEDEESPDHTGLLLLCEVALGKPWELTAAKYVTKVDPKYQSVLGAGETGPDSKNAVVIDNVDPKHKTLDLSVKVPLGPCVKTDLQHGTDTDLLYNEFIVYHPDQVVISYMVKLEFTATGK